MVISRVAPGRGRGPLGMKVTRDGQDRGSGVEDPQDSPSPRAKAMLGAGARGRGACSVSAAASSPMPRKPCVCSLERPCTLRASAAPVQRRLPRGSDFPRRLPAQHLGTTVAKKHSSPLPFPVMVGRGDLGAWRTGGAQQPPDPCHLAHGTTLRPFPQAVPG